MFPTGGAGVGLVVLRSVVATTALIDVGAIGSSGPMLILEGITVLVAICLVSGFLTPYCAALICLLELAILVFIFPPGAYHLLASALTAASVSVLGPGAYSMDSRIFGRKSITIPPRSDSY